MIILASSCWKMPSPSRTSCLTPGLRHVIIIQNALLNTTKLRVRRLRHYATFILTTIVGRRPNSPFSTAASDSVQLRIWHSSVFCPHARRVTVWQTTSSVSQRTHQRTTMMLWLGWTKISSYHPPLISKEIWTIFSALQPSPPWFPYSTSIVWHVSRRLRFLSRAPGWTTYQAAEWALSSTTILFVSASLSASDSLSVFLIDKNEERRLTQSVRTLCRAASALGAFLAIPPKSTSFDVVVLQSGYRPCSNRLVMTPATESY